MSDRQQLGLYDLESYKFDLMKKIGQFQLMLA